MRYLFLLLCLTAAGCRSMNADPDPERVWVAQTFSGGVQCDPESSYEPPDTRDLLEQGGVRVFEVAVETLDVMAVCGAAAYAAVHYALIAEEDVDAALGLGFERSAEPPDYAQQG